MPKCTYVTFHQWSIVNLVAHQMCVLTNQHNQMSTYNHCMYAVYMCGTTSIIVHLHVYLPTLLHDHGSRCQYLYVHSKDVT